MLLGQVVLSPPPPPAFHHVITILSPYKRNHKDNQPEILIVGDFIIRSVILPGAYRLPGDRVSNMFEVCLVLTDLHPTHADFSHVH